MYKQSITIQNSQTGFRRAGLVLYDPEVIISKFDINLQTVTPPRRFTIDEDPWVSQTPHNPTEALLQTTLVKNRIVYHQGSLLTSIFETIALLAKGTKLLTYENTLLHTKIYSLCIANEALSKRCRIKKTHIRQRGVFTIENVHDIFSQTEVNKQIQYNRRFKRGNQNEGNPTIRHYSTCKETGHNSKIYQDTIIIQSLIDLQLV